MAQKEADNQTKVNRKEYETMELTTREGGSPFLLSTAGDSDAAKMSRGEA